jgi:nitroreductase
MAAIAAPSVHNTQPWRFRVHEDVIDLYADHSRQLNVADPSGRELMISLGAALLNLRVAMLARGRLPMLRLLPERDQPDLVARVAIGGPVRPPYLAERLDWAIPRRHSNRRPFTREEIPEAVRSDLQAAARTEGAHLIFADNGLCDAVLNTVRSAENRRRQEPGYQVELSHWTAPIPGRRDGVPAYAYRTPDIDERVPLRDYGMVHPARFGWPAPFEDNPVIGVLYTGADGPLAWLNAGQALERTLLTATVHNLQSTLMTQPLEIPQLRALFDDSAQGRVAQAIIRFGYGPTVPASPRRPLSNIMLDA